MTVSSVDPRRLLTVAGFLAVFFLAVLWAAVPAIAQVPGGAVQDGAAGDAARSGDDSPGRDDAPDGDWGAPADVQRGPIRLFPLSDGDADNAPAADAPREVREGILAIDSLGAVSAEATGLLDPGESDVPLDLWQGSDRAVVAAALKALPVSAPSPARAALARRLLLTAAPPPVSGTGDGGADDAPSLLDLRLDRLLAMGRTEDVRALAGAVSPDARPGASAEPLRRAVANAWFVDGRLDEACSVVADGIDRFDGVYWQKAAAFCDLVGGRPQQANLQLSMLREQGISDAPFFWAADQLSGLKVLSLNGLSEPTPLVIAMLRRIGRPYPAGTLVDPQPWLQRAVALGEETDMETRLQTAEGAFLAGAFSHQDLAALYEGVSFSEVAFSRTLDTIVDEAGARTNALLWQMARKQSVPAARAEVIAAALRAAESRRQGLLADHLYAPMIEALPLAPEFMWFADAAGRALYGAGRLEAARRWFRLSADAAATNSTAALAADRLWPLDRIAFETRSDRWPVRRLEAWRAVQVQGGGRGGNDRGEPFEHRLARLEGRVLSLFQATGDRVSSADWAPLFGRLSGADGLVPPTPAWAAVTEATDSLRVGESILLSLMVLGDVAPGAVSDPALYRVVESLRLVGLEDAARRIAVESAVAAGL